MDLHLLPIRIPASAAEVVAVAEPVARAELSGRIVAGGTGLVPQLRAVDVELLAPAHGPLRAWAEGPCRLDHRRLASSSATGVVEVHDGDGDLVAVVTFRWRLDPARPAGAPTLALARPALATAA